MNLTRDEARGRAALLRVHAYEVELDLTTSERTFRSTSTIRFSCRTPGTSTHVDLDAPVVHAVTLNGQPLDAAAVTHDARVEVAGLAAENVLTVVADCAYSRTGEGLHRFVDPVDGAVYTYTQFEPADAHRVYANFDQPDLKGTFALAVTAPSSWRVVSNSPTPEPVPAGGAEGASTWRFAPTPRISTYLTTLVAGPYHAEHAGYEREGAVVPLSVLCRASLAPYLDAAEIFTVTRQGLDLYQELFDFPYPFGKYDQAFVPEYNLGAMENPGCVTFREEFVFRSKVTDAAYEGRANVVLHEMAHMWFGDLVTMEWWDDLWLKESFADFMGALTQSEATRWTDAWVTFANRRKAWAYRQDQLPSTHPIVANVRDLEDAKLNFDGITYAKGASVLKQLVAWVGRDAFIAAARRYFTRHAWGNTTLGDLLSALEETSGRDLKAWSRSWLETAGINTLRPEYTLDDDGCFTGFHVVQEAPDTWPTLRPHRAAIGLYTRTAAGLTRTRRLELDIDGGTTPVPELTGTPRPDLILLNDDDLTYCKTRFDPHSLATLRDGLGDVDGRMPRALCWSAVWNMTRDALVPPRDYLDLVARFGGVEADIGVAQTLHQQATLALDHYVAPEHRDAARERIAEAAREHLAGAEPGGDHQLAWLRFLAAVASAPEDLALLRGLLEGTREIPGLTVDQDLRWTLWEPLVVHGRASDEEIEAELARDATASGRRHALRCRAARPTPEAKEAAWRSVVESDDLPNAAVDAVIGGFRQPSQRALLAPYAARYFGAVPTVWGTRSPEIAIRIVSSLFPDLQTDDATLARTDAWLASAPEIPALRRLVAEGRDDLARALRAQGSDRAAGL